MFITTSNLVYYLIERGLVSSDSVVDGDWMVIETPRRNRNFKVIRRQHPSFFLKQIQNWDPQSIATLQGEAKCYWLAQSNPDFAALSPLLPKYYDFDPGRYILILELLKEGEDLTEYHRRLNAFPPEVAKKLAKGLGAYHRIAPNHAKEIAENPVFPKKVPWILSVDQLNAGSFGAMSRGNSQVVSIVQQYPEFQQHLLALRSQWRFDSLIHGDIKWDNCVAEGAAGGKEVEIKIVDWELADWGDACWDVGAILQAYLSFWIFSMPATIEMPPAELVKHAQYPLELMQPAIRAFWESYTETRQVEGRDATEMLERSVKCGAARMIQTAYEYMYYSSQISASTLCLLQVSLNVLSQPQQAIGDLLGL
ncbi:MAG: phosphotransferase [Terriglobia bacterium]